MTNPKQWVQHVYHKRKATISNRQLDKKYVVAVDVPVKMCYAIEIDPAIQYDDPNACETQTQL